MNDERMVYNFSTSNTEWTRQQFPFRGIHSYILGCKPGIFVTQANKGHITRATPPLLKRSSNLSIHLSQMESTYHWRILGDPCCHPARICFSFSWEFLGKIDQKNRLATHLKG